MITVIVLLPIYQKRGAGGVGFDSYFSFFLAILA